MAKSLAMEQSWTVSGCLESKALAAFLTMDLEATTWVITLVNLKLDMNGYLSCHPGQGKLVMLSF